MAAWAASVALLAALVCLHTSIAFKEQDFKKCDTASFCKRNRGVKGTKFVVDSSTITVEGGVLTATLKNAGVPDPAYFRLSLLSYGGIVRLHVDEPAPFARYQVPDILEPTLEAKLSAWEQTSQGPAHWIGASGATNVRLAYSPFRLEVYVGETEAFVINSRDMFMMEHRREKQDGAPEGWWDESFNGHPDSKPKGPQALSLDMSFPGFSHVYGLPERATHLALKPTAGVDVVSEPYRLYNLDVFEYLDASPFGLYGSIPYMVAHKAGLTVGAFWLNAAEMFVDVEAPPKGSPKAGTQTQWIAESGVVDLFLLPGPSPPQLAAQYAALTGPTALPPLFAIGYHQCRWNYKDEADVRQVDAGFDEHAIPYDVIWLDIEHTNGKRYLTWDAHLFPQPAQLQDDLASRGRRTVTIVDPHVKRDSAYYIHREAQSLGHYVKNKDGGDFDGWCWPGSSSYLDVSSPVVRAWWVQQFGLDKYVGSTKHLYIWNDMNEPSVFNGPEITMPKDVLHYGDVEHRDLHNVFGYYYHLATAQALEARGLAVWGPGGDRPFVLSRAFFAGTQRVGPIWTGDNSAQWPHLKVSVPMLLTLGVTGLPFSGADVGGFFGNPDVELLTRWYQLGAYYPFFRGHAHLETQRREPWLFGDDATRRIRDAIRSRYAVLPYLYTLFRHANVSGQPVLRPLWWEFPDAPETFAEEEALMLGPGILIRPVLQAGVASVDVLLPRAAAWYDARNGAAVERRSWLPGLDHTVRVPVTMEAIPIYYRGGHIVPRRERARRSTVAMAADPFTLVVALDANGTASGELYLDDGQSYGFRRGEYLHRRFTFKDGKLTNSALPTPPLLPPGSLESALTIERVVVLGLPDKAYVARSGDATFEVVKGAVEVQVAQGGAAQVVRNPRLPITGDWSLTLEPAAS